jgi:hypothetical protein
MGFVVDKAALGQAFLRVLRIFPVNIVPPQVHIRVIFCEMDNGPVTGRSSVEA